MNQPSPPQKGFFAALFDFSFTSYVTPKIIKVIFGIVIVVSGLAALFFAVATFRVNVVLGVFFLLIIAPLVFLLYVILYRVLLEVVMAVFTIAENTTKLVQASAAPISTPPPPPPPPSQPTGHQSPPWPPPPPPQEESPPPG